MDKLSSGVGGILAKPGFSQEMKQIAKRPTISPYQIEAYAAGCHRCKLYADLKRWHQKRRIQIPMRYVHSYEVCDIRDVVDSVELLYWYVRTDAQI